jgi:hypothetical protein
MNVAMIADSHVLMSPTVHLLRKKLGGKKYTVIGCDNVNWDLRIV